MAINDPDNTQAGNEQKTEGQSAKTSGSMFSSFHSGGLFAAPISRGVGSEYYSKLKTSLTDIYKQADSNVEISLIDLDNSNEPALQFSSLVVALRFKSEPDLGVAYHILLLEATGDKVTPINDTVGGPMGSQQIEIYRVTSDALDDVLVKMAADRVRKAFPQGPWLMVDGCVVPSGFNPDDKGAVHQLALNAGLASSTELSIRRPGFQDLNLARVAHDSSMSINIGIQRQQISNTVGQPVRSDVQASFTSKKANQQGKFAPINSGDKEAKISEFSGFVDVLWNPVAPQNTLNPWVNPAMSQMQTQKYMAHMVITNLVSTFGYTPGMVLLSLATALSMRDDGNWIQTFRPLQTGRDEVDITDIGALNIEANLANDPSGVGQRIDTKADSFKLEDLGQLVAAMMQPGLIISLDYPEVGPQSWYLSVFAAAARGSEPAQRIIYEAAQKLTNDSFGRYFPKGAPMFVNVSRIHLGTWTDRMGQKRDIRDIDHIAVCNLVGERNPQVIREWSDTFWRAQVPEMVRLYTRKRMITSLTQESANFTGFAQRLTFSKDFLDALVRGIKDTNLPIRVNTPLTGADFNNQRGVASFAAGALLAPGQSFAAPAGSFFAPQFAQGGGFNYRY